MLEITLVQGFCPLKIKITQFPDGFGLKSLQNTRFIIIQSWLGWASLAQVFERETYFWVSIAAIQSYRISL